MGTFKRRDFMSKKATIILLMLMLPARFSPAITWIVVCLQNMKEEMWGAEFEKHCVRGWSLRALWIIVPWNDICLITLPLVLPVVHTEGSEDI